MKYFTRRKLGDIELLVSVTDVSVASDHLVVEHGHEGLDSENVVAEDEALNHVHLGAADLVVSVLLVPHSVLIEPIVGFGLRVEGIAEVGWTRARHPVHGAVVQQEVVDKLLVSSLIVLLHDSKVSDGSST